MNLRREEELNPSPNLPIQQHLENDGYEVRQEARHWATDMRKERVIIMPLIK